MVFLLPVLSLFPEKAALLNSLLTFLITLFSFALQNSLNRKLMFANSRNNNIWAQYMLAPVAAAAVLPEF